MLSDKDHSMGSPLSNRYNVLCAFKAIVPISQEADVHCITYCEVVIMVIMTLLMECSFIYVPMLIDARYTKHCNVFHTR